jgi:thiamine-monophosphate kinase
VLRRSGVGAELQVDAMPRSGDLASLPEALQRVCTLAGGDDYELVFTAAPERAAQVAAAGAAARVAVTRIGRIRAEPGLVLTDRHGQHVDNTFGAFDHFKS